MTDFLPFGMYYWGIRQISRFKTSLFTFSNFYLKYIEDLLNILGKILSCGYPLKTKLQEVETCWNQWYNSFPHSGGNLFQSLNCDKLKIQNSIRTNYQSKTDGNQLKNWQILIFYVFLASWDF